MLINLSNHPAYNVEDHSRAWSKEQWDYALSIYENIVDVDFPNINPNWCTDDILREVQYYFMLCENLFKKRCDKNNAVHLAGELVFCFLLAQLLLKSGYECITSTTERNVKEEDGVKKSTFEFVRFRNYKLI
jgi:hypothetical protein